MAIHSKDDRARVLNCSVDSSQTRGAVEHSVHVTIAVITRAEGLALQEAFVAWLRSVRFEPRVVCSTEESKP